MAKSKKKNLKVRDLAPKKDAKGGAVTGIGPKGNTGSGLTGSGLTGSGLTGTGVTGTGVTGTGVN